MIPSAVRDVMHSMRIWPSATSPVDRLGASRSPNAARATPGGDSTAAPNLDRVPREEDGSPIAVPRGNRCDDVERIARSEC